MIWIEEPFTQRKDGRFGGQKMSEQEMQILLLFASKLFNMMMLSEAYRKLEGERDE